MYIRLRGNEDYSLLPAFCTLDEVENVERGAFVHADATAARAGMRAIRRLDDASGLDSLEADAVS